MLLHASMEEVRRPTNMELRLGAQSGVLQYCPTKLVPRSIITSRFGFRVTLEIGWEGSTVRPSISSHWKNTMFLAPGFEGGSGGAGGTGGGGGGGPGRGKGPVAPDTVPTSCLAGAIVVKVRQLSGNQKLQLSQRPPSAAQAAQQLSGVVPSPFSERRWCLGLERAVLLSQCVGLHCNW
eukprot:SAG25_NODE_1590_length_2721_cov_2.485889_6_plen_179_part_00